MLATIGLFTGLPGCNRTAFEPCAPASVQPAYSDAICLAGMLPGGTLEEARKIRAFFLERAVEAGVRTFRDDFSWPEIEPEKGRYEFAAVDAKVNDIAAAGAREIGLIAYGNVWASKQGQDCEEHGGSSCGNYPPDDPADYARFAAALASRYAGTIRDWEIWNEQNSGFRFWLGAQFGGDPAAYGELLKASGSAVRSANSAAKVAYGGLFYHAQVITGAAKFLELSFDAHPDLAVSFDALAYHPYPQYPPSVPPEEGAGAEMALTDMHTSLVDILGRFGAAQKELWITEVGWPVYGDVTEDLQARYLVRAVMLGISAGATRVCLFNFQDGPNYMKSPPEEAFGLYHYSADRTLATPKPSYEALKNMSALLGGTRYRCDLREPLGLPEEDYAPLFEAEDGRKVLALWRFSDADSSISLTRLREDVGWPTAARDYLGNTVQLAGDLILSGGPVFVEFSK